ENLLRGLAIAPASPLLVALGILAGALLGCLVVWRCTGWATAVLAAAGCVGILLASWLALRFGRIHVPPTAPALALLLVTGSQSALDFARERRMRAGVVRAFSQYLSPVLVERLAERPEHLQLGGERRELTILFC